MKKMIALSGFVAFAFLPMGCSDPGAPSAPSAPSVSASDSATKNVPPPPVKKGKKQVAPGGRSAMEQ